MKIQNVLICLGVFFLIACTGSGSINKKSNIGIVESCLQKSLQQYYNNEEFIYTLLENEGLLDGSKKSYEALCKRTYDGSLGTFKMADSDRKKLDFMGTFGPHALIHQCSNQVESDSVLTQNQKLFFGWFYDSGNAGSLDMEALHRIIYQMSEQEFNAASVRETTLFFCGHYVIKNYFIN